VSGRTRAWLKTKNPDFEGKLEGSLDLLVAELGSHPLADGEVREVEGMTGLFVSLSQSQPEDFEYAVLSEFERAVVPFLLEGG
jgi:hypothetical protein